MDAMGKDAFIAYHTPALRSKNGDELLYPIRLPNPETGRIETFMLRIKPEAQQLYNSLAGKLPGWLQEALSSPGTQAALYIPTMLTKGIRLGAVGVSHTFQAANTFLMRDAFTAMQQIDSPNLPKNYNPLDIFLVAGKIFPYTAASWWLGIKRVFAKNPAQVGNPIQRMILRSGGELMRSYPMSPAGVRSQASTIRGHTSTGAQILSAFSSRAHLALKALGSGEMGSRTFAYVDKLDQLGYTKARIEAELKKNPNQDPIPYHIHIAAMNAYAEAAIDFGRVGSVAKEYNKINPFFGPWIASNAQQIGKVIKSPLKMASLLVSGTILYELLHWLLYHKEPWYKELGEDQNRYYNIMTPWGMVALPKSLGLDQIIGNFVRTGLQGASGQNPHLEFAVGDALRRMSHDLLPPPAPTALQIATNRNWSGGNIVPQRAQDMPASEQFRRWQAPYAVEQLSGGALSSRRLRLPFAGREPRQSVNDLYDEQQRLQGLASVAREDGRNFGERKRSLVVTRFINLLSDTWPLVRQGGNDANAIREFQLAVAQIAMERPPGYNPFTQMDRVPTPLRDAVQKFKADVGHWTHQRTQIRGGTVQANRERQESVEAAREVLRLMRR